MITARCMLFCILVSMCSACASSKNSSQLDQDAGSNRIDGGSIDGPFADAQGWHEAGGSDSGSWSGPLVRVVNRNGYPRLSINGAEQAPFFFAINSQGGLQDNWDAVDYELSLAEEFGNPIISMLISTNELVGSQDISERAKAVFNRILEHHPHALFLPRVVFHNPSLPKLLLRNFSNVDHLYIWNSITEDWIEDQEQAVTELLQRLDQLYPGKIAGVHLAYLETNEWFYPFDQNSFGDYTDGVAKNFCSSMGLAPGNPLCALPSPTERNHATYGNTFLTGPDPVAIRGYTFNRFLSNQVGNAIIRLSRAIKTVSEGRAFTMPFYGYLHVLGGPRLAGSGHLNTREVLKDPAVDAISAPYQYLEEVRAVGGPMLPHGPSDSPWIYGKMWVHEDDTHTHLCTEWPPFTCGQARNLTETVYYLRRNVYTAAIHRNGIYMFDLLQGGWFGKPGEPSSRDIWINLSLLRDRMTQLSTLSGDPLESQIAVFVDDKSPAHMTLMGGAGGRPEFSYSIHAEQALAWSQLGAPVRHYLLSDLLEPTFPANRIRLAVFANAFVMSSHIRDAIRTKLERDGKTLMYIYAPNSVSTTGEPLYLGPSEVTGISLTSTAEASLVSDFQSAGTIPGWNALAGQSFGANYPVSPRFSGTDANAVVLARYRNGNTPSIVYKNFATHRAIFVGSPGLPPSACRAIAESAGVHFYTDSIGDTIEASGNAIMVHVNQGGSRTLRLPITASRVVEDTLGETRVQCTGCSSFTTRAMDPGGVILYWVQP